MILFNTSFCYTHSKLIVFRLKYKTAENLELRLYLWHLESLIHIHSLYEYSLIEKKNCLFYLVHHQPNDGKKGIRKPIERRKKN